MSATIKDVLRVRDNICRRFQFADTQNIVFIIGRKAFSELRCSAEAYQYFNADYRFLLGSDLVIAVEPDLIMATIK